MRWSKAFIPTLRDDPADAEAASHKLLVRGGFIRQLMAGSYALLPLGQRVARKVEAIVRKEMEAIGAQEFVLPCLQPSEPWERSGRWQTMGEELFRLRDRKGADLALGMTHEEIFSVIASELRSYKQLPQAWYQFQTKFRDEARPKSGLLRVREFTMKDSYSFDLDEAGLDASFDRHFEAYRKIFARLGLDAIAVEASSGNMGGSDSIEFMARSDAGEDWVAVCASCGYAANFEKATSKLAPVEDAPAASAAPEKFPTPGVRTIDDLARMQGGAPAERQVKTLVYVVDGKTVLVLLRGDHQLVEQKLRDQVEASELRPATGDEIVAAMGAHAGSLGAVGVAHFAIADEALRGRANMVTGANEDDFHLRGVDVERDIDVKGWLDLREVKAGEACPMCESALGVAKTVEVGHIFKLGTKYAEALDVKVLGEDGKQRTVIMGSYGIGIGRNVAAVVEAHHDEKGICWPVNVAPYEVVVSVLDAKQVEPLEAGERIYEKLLAAGIDAILDDRDERPGVKFKDAELVGIPFRITVGPKGLAEGKVEVVRRRDGETSKLDVEKAADHVAELVLESRR
ncbi:MAG: proline--tRNA ligase [Myxococcota bacterium]|nr:proline--tRNA ligase [Myxococcales bacterium]